MEFEDPPDMVEVFAVTLFAQPPPIKLLTLDEIL
jgi:hypothetical protein